MADDTPQTLPLKGSCHCGAVRFLLHAAPNPVLTCHCSQCRKTSGHLWAASSVPRPAFELTGAESLSWYRSSAKAQRGFCRDCGASLFWDHQDESNMFFAPGALDSAADLPIGAHIFTEDAADYYRFAGQPPRPDQPPPARLDCSCLCGDVAFSLPGPAGEVTACHCSQCRKLSGYFAASFDADPASVTFHRKQTLAEYETAGGGARGFCRRCGSSLYFRAANGDFSVEAGAVNGPTGGRLTSHIHTESCGSYYHIDGDLTDGRG